MADQKIATERIYAEDAQGVNRLVAAPGDPIPDDASPVGYVEAIDLEADTADARMAKGEKPVDMVERVEDAKKAEAERYAEKYAPPLPKPGEEGEAKAASEKAKKADSAEDKARKKD